MRLYKNVLVVLLLIVSGSSVFGQEFLGKCVSDLKNSFVQGRDHVIEVSQNKEGFQVIQDKRDQRNMKHRLVYNFSINDDIVDKYSILYPVNSFMEEEVSMFLEMNEDKEACSEDELEINGQDYSSKYAWDTDVLLMIEETDNTLKLIFSKEMP